MASTENEAMKRLRSLSECCICLTTYTDPRMLPCFHTACLKCLEDIQLKNEKKPGDVLPCPLCRNEYLIPADGMEGLHRNFFIKSLTEVTSALNLENKSRPCEMCSVDEEVKDVMEATMRCLNCRENYCTRCSKIHRALKSTKDHKIVELDIDVDEEEIRNTFPIRKCVRHSDKVLDYYCSDCKTVVCVSCFVENHKAHECKDVKTVDKEFRQRIERSFTEMNYSKDKMLSRKCELEKKKRDVMEKVLETESDIRKKNQELKALIDQHTEELLNELSLLKQQQVKKMDAEIEQIERKLAAHESLVTFGTELKSKESPSEVCGSVDSLITRANELRKENDEYLRAPSKPFDFEFIATDHDALQNAENIIGQLSGGGASGMKRAAEQQRKMINVSLEHNITLNTSKNAWKPILGKPSLKEGEITTEELYKKIRGILNKLLTPQTFQTLIQQVLHLPINTEERLAGCVDIIFEKAISEPNLSVAYANMARRLTCISVPLATDPSQMITFRKLLLNKCQEEFEKDEPGEHDTEALENQIAEASSDEKRKALTEQRDAVIYRAKCRSLGNIRLIGELFKVKMLTERIMHDCLKKLLKSYKDEDIIECLCQLLTSIGQDIDKKQSGTSIMNEYFYDLQNLVDQKKTSSRIRFMIQDLIELRKNKWVPRRQN